MKKLLLTVAPLCLAAASLAQVNYTGGTYSENFDTLATTTSTNYTWTDNTTIAGWYSNWATYRASPGSDTTTSLYSYGLAATNPLEERALGAYVNSGGPVMFGLLLSNQTGHTINEITVSYRGEQWRRGSTNTQNLNFEYKVNASGISYSGFVAYSALDFVSPHLGSALALDGNASPNFTMVSSTLTLGTPLAVGDTLFLRWTDGNDLGTDHGMGIDDVTFTESVPEPATMFALAAGSLVALRRRRKKSSQRSGQQMERPIS